MSYQNLSDPAAVLDAIAECDALGRDTFLTKYGFGRARNYFLIYKGKTYDSKAILGAAHGFQYGEPLTPYDFSGGYATVQPKMKELGFVVVGNKVLNLPDTHPNEVGAEMWEGGRESVTVNRYERNAKARIACIEHHGDSCAVCGFSFGTVYGEEYAGFIHVHHIKPISQVGENYKIDPVKDLIPLCPNCHAIVHFGGKLQDYKSLSVNSEV